MTPLEHVAAALIALVGAAIQGIVGFGSNLFAAPLLALVEPTLVPGPALGASLVLNVLISRREPAAHAWSETRWPIVGMVPGATIGALLVAGLADKALTILFAILVLVAVGLSISGLHPRRTPRTLAVAGGASGFMATIAAIGGPPMALLYQHASGTEIRAALSRFFGVSCLVSLTLLSLTGKFGWAEARDTLLLLPGTVIGYLVSGRLIGHVDRRHVRVLVLGLSAAAAVVAIIKAIR